MKYESFGTFTPVTCIECGSGHLHRHGRSASGDQRMKCRTCGTTFDRHSAARRQAPTRKSLRMSVARDMVSVEFRSSRALAADLGVSPPTIHRARADVLTWIDGWVAVDPVVQQGIVSAATVRLRENRKGSREWQRHERNPEEYAAPDRLQWEKYGRTPPADIVEDFQVACMFTADRAGHLGGAMLDDDAAAILEAIAAGSPGDITPIVRNGALIQPASGLLQPQAPAAAGVPAAHGLTTVSDLAERFLAFHARLGHVATKNLPRYLPWFLWRVLRGLS